MMNLLKVENIICKRMKSFKHVILLAYTQFIGTNKHLFKTVFLCKFDGV